MGVKIILVTQARSGSSRLPEKVLMEIDGEPILKIHLNRISKSKRIDKIVVATTTNMKDDKLVDMVNDWGYEIYRGSELDVLDRFYKSVKDENPEYVVRVTSDCPLIDPVLIDEVIDYALKSNVDYCSNSLNEVFPDGQDVEIMKFSALKIAWENAIKKSDREHVTPFLRRSSTYNNNTRFSSIAYTMNDNFSKIRMTIDEQLDFELIKNVIINCGKDKSWKEYTDYIISNKLYNLTQNIIRNEGYLKSLKND